MTWQEPTVVHVCTYPGSGGAGLASIRLVGALSGLLPRIELLGLACGAIRQPPRVRGLAYGHSLSESVWRRWRAWQCRRAQFLIDASEHVPAGFFTDRSTHGWALAKALQDADLVHFHWVNDLLDYGHVFNRIRPGVPVVWTLHDMSPFTGGCCYALGCRRFQNGCGRCPQLSSHRRFDLSARSLLRRKSALRAIRSRLHLIAPSAWLAGMAMSSQLFAGLSCTVIPNPQDLACFTPERRDRARSQMGLDRHTALVLFVAASITNPVKGMFTLLEALPLIQLNCSIPLQFACIGSKPDALPQTVRWLGQISDPEELAAVYAAADLLVVPSLIDNAPNVIAEAHASGLPVLATGVGGIPEMIDVGVTGQLVPAANAAALSASVIKLLPDVMAHRQEWSLRCRAAAEAVYAPEKVADLHLQLYRHAWSQKAA